MTNRIIIEGGVPLRGALDVSGSKNSVLPLMAAALLTDETSILRGVPRIADVQTLISLLNVLGADVEEFHDRSERGLIVRADDVTSVCAPSALVSKMRAGFWVIGPLLARTGRALVALPGGCAIGRRPVDLYLDALSGMGADIDVHDGHVYARADGGLTGARINLPFVSVGVTHVLTMAACLAEGETIITNAATEPEVVEVCGHLQRMGARMEGIGTRRLRIVGRDRLHGADHRVRRDRIEAGAFALAAASTGGDVTLNGIDASDLGALADALRDSGVVLRDRPADGRPSLNVRGPEGRPTATSVTTGPHPAFATDFQPPFLAFMCRAEGDCVIRENVFENRFQHVRELRRMGADILSQGDAVRVRGVDTLRGTTVEATDLRASAALVIAGLAAQGTTVVDHAHHLDRGYEDIERKLTACGARVRRETA